MPRHSLPADVSSFGGTGWPRPAILIISGGGYDRLTDTQEQAPVAGYFVSQLHVTAFVLRSRPVRRDGTYRYPIPLRDGQRAIRVLRASSATLGIDSNAIAVFGFSTGGQLASTLALHPTGKFGAILTDATDRRSARVDLLGLGYPVISMIQTPFRRLVRIAIC